MAYTDQQRRSHIRELQGMLHGISYYNPAIPRIVPDGIYGEATARAVRDFQQYYGLTASGEVNAATWERVAEVFQELTGTTPEPLEAFPEEKQAVVSLGERSFTVLIIQSILHELSQTYDAVPDCPLSGVFDDETLRSVQPFQKLCGLPVTGGVDCRTWNMLAMASKACLL